MTVQPTRDQPMTDHDRMNYWWRRATQAEARIKAALELHASYLAYRLIDGEDFAQEPDGDVCATCGEYYPCPTIRALDG